MGRQSTWATTRTVAAETPKFRARTSSVRPRVPARSGFVSTTLVLVKKLLRRGFVRTYPTIGKAARIYHH